MNAPVLPTRDVAPTSESARTTPAVSSVWFGAAMSLNDLTKLLATMPVPDQYAA